MLNIALTLKMALALKVAERQAAEVAYCKKSFC